MFNLNEITAAAKRGAPEILRFKTRSKMKMANRISLYLCIWGLVASLAVAISSCGQKEMSYDTNLLNNPSFEDVSDGIPKHWTLVPFRGLENQQAVEYGIDNNETAEGENSWRFTADPGTERWYSLTQEVEVRDITHVRLRGWMQLEGVKRHPDQYAQCNFLLTFYDENHNRFQEVRFADKRTRFKYGTISWFHEDQVFRVPKGTRYVAVQCILGCDGIVWFDGVELSVPQPLDWQSRSTENFVFNWLPERPFPAGSIENEQRMFNDFAKRLGTESDIVIHYYLYPDTATIQKILSLRGHQYISWDDLEIHTINPNDNHEIIHFITDVYGIPPRAIAEGTVFWLHGAWYDRPIHQLAAYHLSTGNLPTIAELINYNEFAMIDAHYKMPAAASFVGYLVDRWGVEKLIELYRGVGGFNSYDAFAQVFEKIYDFPCSEVEKAWHMVLAGTTIEESSKLDPES